MEILCWILLTVTAVWCFVSLKYSYGKRVQLRSYVIFLLLNDEIRDDHKSKFKEWISNSKAKNALQLSSRSQHVIDQMAEGLANKGNSILGAASMLWNSEAANVLREK